ncbi:MAG: hypothetical protein JSV56_06820 [Methanomassiliicoccales archaeon]|nr:MAG: hypothetical protein JSV56_06820 [Methanomassiliicoccales archaeon]
MKYVKGILSIITVLLLLGAFLPSTTAEMDSLKVILVAEEGQYEPGDNITIELRVYDKGELVDADITKVKVNTRWEGNEQVILMSQEETGIYRASYQILDDDHFAAFSAYAEKGTDSDRTELNVDISHPQLHLDIQFCHQSRAYVWPGDTVCATLTARYRDELIDVDEFTTLKLIDPEEKETDLTTTWVSVGTYEVTCVTHNLTKNGDYELETRASYANSHASATAYITVNVLTVWYNLISVAGNTATFTLGVADQNGIGVANAKINIKEPQKVSEITSENGTAIFSLTGIHNGAHVFGEVESEGRKQSFSGYIYTPDDEETIDPARDGFDVIYDGSESIYSSGSSITRNYLAYSSCVPIQEGEIHYYITLEGMDIGIAEGYIDTDEGWHFGGTSKIIKTGTVTTNELGEFSISFKAPQRQGLVYLHFESGIQHDNPHEYSDHDRDDDLIYEEDLDNVFVYKGNLWNAESITIESDPLVIGGKTTVTVKTSQSLNDEDRLFAKWMAGEPSSVQYNDAQESEWTCWVDGGNCIFLEKTDDSNVYEGQSIIPDFMDDDEDYTLVAGTVDSDTGHPNFNHQTLKEGEKAGDDGLEILLILLLGAAILVIIIILGFGAFSEKQKADTSSPQQPSGAPPQDTAPLSSDVPTQPQSASPPPSSELSSLPQSDIPTGDYKQPLEAEEQLPKSNDTQEGAVKK